MTDRLLKPLHVGVGILTVFIFLGTGIYMTAHFPGAYDATEVIRYQYRANHIYILFSALVNIVLGLHMGLNEARRRRILQRIGSIFLLAAPVFLIFAFIVEPQNASPERPLTFFGVVFSLTGTALQFLGVFRFKQLTQRGGNRLNTFLFV